MNKKIMASGRKAGRRLGAARGSALRPLTADDVTKANNDGYDLGRKHGHEERADILEWAWSVIANAGGGNWKLETPEWQEVAAKWRDEYHKLLPAPNGRSEPQRENEHEKR